LSGPSWSQREQRCGLVLDKAGSELGQQSRLACSGLSGDLEDAATTDARGLADLGQEHLQSLLTQEQTT